MHPSWENHKRLAEFYISIDRFEEAVPHYEACTRLAATDEQKAESLSSLAGLLYKQNDYENAEKHYREALEIRRDLAARHPEAFRPVLANTLNNLALLQSGRHKYEESEKLYSEALEILRELANQHPEALPDLAMTQINLAIFYLQSVVDEEKSLEMAVEAIKNLRSFKPYPQIEAYRRGAYKVLQGWGIEDVEKFMREKYGGWDDFFQPPA